MIELNSEQRKEVSIGIGTILGLKNSKLRWVVFDANNEIILINCMNAFMRPLQLKIPELRKAINSGSIIIYEDNNENQTKTIPT